MNCAICHQTAPTGHGAKSSAVEASAEPAGHLQPPQRQRPELLSRGAARGYCPHRTLKELVVFKMFGFFLVDSGAILKIASVFVAINRLRLKCCSFSFRISNPTTRCQNQTDKWLSYGSDPLCNSLLAWCWPTLAWSLEVELCLHHVIFNRVMKNSVWFHVSCPN